MKIHTLIVGPIKTNCYIVEDEPSKQAMIVDPGDNAEEILDLLAKEKLKPLSIVVTHGHFDHISANRILKAKLNIPIMMHQADQFGLATGDSPPADQLLKAGDHFEVGSLKFEVLHTPGHSPGGISLYCKEEKVVFTGDTLFYDTWGRTDLPFSSEIDMILSLKKLLKLPPETKVYPGHGWSTTIENEQKLLDEL